MYLLNANMHEMWFMNVSEGGVNALVNQISMATQLPVSRTKTTA